MIIKKPNLNNTFYQFYSDRHDDQSKAGQTQMRISGISSSPESLPSTTPMDNHNTCIKLWPK